MKSFEELINACTNGDIAQVIVLLKDPEIEQRLKDGDTQAYLAAAYHDHNEVVKMLLGFDSIRKYAVSNNELCKLVSVGAVKVAKELLMLDEVRNNAAAHENSALRSAALNGHTEIVKLLLSIDAVKNNAAAVENEALLVATENGHTQIQELLLMVASVKLFYECSLGNHEIVSELLKDPEFESHAADSNNQALHWAAINGHTEIVKLLLSIDAVKNNAAAIENKALRWAAINGHIEIVKLLLSIDAVKNNAAVKRNEALLLTTKSGHTEIVKLLLSIDEVKNNAAVKENQALHMAIEKGHTEIAKLLLSIDAVKNNAAVKNNEALRLAIKNGHTEIVKLLLSIDEVKNNAAVNQKEALRVAAGNGHTEIVKLLLSIDAVKNNTESLIIVLRTSCRQGYTEIVKLLLSIDAVKKIVAANENEALRLATENGQTQIQELLLKIAPVKLVYECSRGNHEIVRELLKDPEFQSHAPDTDNEALRLAAKNGHTEIVKLLLTIDEVRNNAAAYENEALQWAALNGHAEIVKLLLSIDAVKNNATASGNVALLSAAQNGHTEIVKLLLSIDEVKNNTKSLNIAFQQICREGQTEIVKLFLDIDLIKKNAIDGLLKAVEKGHTEVVKLLLSIEEVRNNAATNNNEALSVAAENDRTEIVKLLLSIDEVKNNAAISENYALRVAAATGHAEVVKLLLDIDEVKNKAAINENEAFLLTVQNGHTEAVKLLLSIDEVKNNAAVKENEALILAVQNGHTEIVRLLLFIDAVKNNAAVNQNEALKLAVQDGDTEIVKLLLSIDAVKNNAAVNQNEALKLAVQNGHTEIVKLLLSIDAVKNNAAINQNEALELAVQNGHTEIQELLLKIAPVQLVYECSRGNHEIVSELLKDPEFKCHVSDNDNEALRLAAKNGHTEIVKLLLTIDEVKNNAAAYKNEALQWAAQNGHTEIVKLLLSIDAVKNNAAASENKALLFAAENGHTDVVKLLLAIPGVTRVSNYESLNTAIERALGNDEMLELLMPFLSVYGFRLSAIFREEYIKKILSDQDQLGFLISDPIQFIDDAMPLNQVNPTAIVSAIRLLAAHSDVKKLEQTYTENSETAQSPRLLKAADDLYKKAQDIYGPTYKTYVDKATSEEEGLAEIEKNIRMMLLNRIEAETHDETVKEFIQNNKEALSTGQHESLMKQAQIYFNSNTNNNQIAWRAYDQWAPVEGWSNLLTPQTSDETVYAAGVNEGEESMQPLNKVALESRRRVAHYYLCLKDTTTQFTIDKDTREGIFVGQIAEIRRAHNFGEVSTTDNPSCYPGTVGRIATMGAGHPILNLVDPIKEAAKIIQGMLRIKLAEKMKGLDEESQEKLYWAIIALTFEQAKYMQEGKEIELETMDGKKIDEAEWVKLRQEIIDSLGTVQEVLDHVNKEFSERVPAIPPFDEDEFVYITRQLTDINYEGVGISAAEQYKPKPVDVRKAIEDEIFDVQDPFNTKPLQKQLEALSKNVSLNPKTMRLESVRIKRNLEQSLVQNEIFKAIFQVISNNEDISFIFKGKEKDLKIIIKEITAHQYNYLQDKENTTHELEMWVTNPRISEDIVQKALEAYEKNYKSALNEQMKKALPDIISNIKVKLVKKMDME